MTSIVPTPGPDAAAAAEAEEHRSRRTDDRGERAGDLDRGLAGDDPGEDDRQGALEQVADDDDRRPLATEGPQRVRAARPPGADRPRVGPAADPGDEDAERDRAGEVRHDDEGQVDGEGARVHARWLRQRRPGPTRARTHGSDRRARGARAESSTGPLARRLEGPGVHPTRAVRPARPRLRLARTSRVPSSR